MQKTVSILLGLFFLTLCFTGCGNPVITGTVKFDDGSPVDFGAVTFTDDKVNFSAPIGKDGSFKTEGTDYKGLPPSTYRVFISGAVLRHKVINGNIMSAEMHYRLPEKYTSVEASGLTIEVKRGGKKTYDIVIPKADIPTGVKRVSVYPLFPVLSG